MSDAKVNPTYLCVVAGSGLSVPQWDFMGSTMVTNSHIRLTSDHQSKQGAIWNNVVSALMMSDDITTYVLY